MARKLTPLEQRVMPAVRLGVWATLTAESVVGVGQAVHGAMQGLSRGGSLVDDVVGAFCSFTPDTLVATGTGLIPIGEIIEGEYVLAYNEATGEIGYYPLVAVWSHEDRVIVRLIIDGELVETTPEHPFYTAEGEWMAAGALRVGEQIRQADGSYGVVQSLRFVVDPQAMYNLTVAGAHTYFVGVGQWLVHNECPIHHIATNKNDISSNRGGPWTPRFQELFDNAGVDIDGMFNKVPVENHYGPHPEAYHQEVYDRLLGAVDGLDPGTPEYTASFVRELVILGRECATQGCYLNDLITK